MVVIKYKINYIKHTFSFTAETRCLNNIIYFSVGIQNNSIQNIIFLMHYMAVFDLYRYFQQYNSKILMQNFYFVVSKTFQPFYIILLKCFLYGTHIKISFKKDIKSNFSYCNQYLYFSTYFLLITT